MAIMLDEPFSDVSTWLEMLMHEVPVAFNNFRAAGPFAQPAQSFDRYETG
jgi:hypothetical protein